MEIKHEVIEEINVITVIDLFLNAENSHQLQSEVKRIFEKNTQHELVINLKNLEMLDSSGIGTLAVIFRLIDDNNGHLVISNANTNIQGFLKLVRFDQLLTLSESQEEAIQLIKSSRIDKN